MSGRLCKAFAPPFMLYHLESGVFDKSIDPIGTPTITAPPVAATLTPALSEQGNFRLVRGMTRRGKTIAFVALMVTPMPSRFLKMTFEPYSLRGEFQWYNVGIIQGRNVYTCGRVGCWTTECQASWRIYPCPGHLSSPRGNNAWITIEFKVIKMYSSIIRILL